MPLNTYTQSVPINISYLCVLIAALLPYLFTVLAKTGKGYTNRAPREYLEKVTGWRKRAHWAQQNGFEAFPAFAAAVTIANLSPAMTPKTMATITLLSITFVISRILYGFFYIADLATLRSTVWFIAFVCVIALFVIGAR